jgi:hypothetical protein
MTQTFSQESVSFYSIIQNSEFIPKIIFLLYICAYSSVLEQCCKYEKKKKQKQKQKKNIVFGCTYLIGP